MELIHRDVFNLIVHHLKFKDLVNLGNTSRSIRNLVLSIRYDKDATISETYPSWIYALIRHANVYASDEYGKTSKRIIVHPVESLHVHASRSFNLYMKKNVFSTYSNEFQTLVKISQVKTLKIHNVTTDVHLPNNTEHLILRWDHFIYTPREDYIDIRGKSLRCITIQLYSIEAKDVRRWILSEIKCNIVAPHLEIIKIDTHGRTDISESTYKTIFDVLKAFWKSTTNDQRNFNLFKTRRVKRLNDLKRGFSKAFSRF